MHRNKFYRSIPGVCLLLQCRTKWLRECRGRQSSGRDRKIRRKLAAGKIPVTTASEPARKEYFQGRDLQRETAHPGFHPTFRQGNLARSKLRLAELNRAKVSPTGKEFFDHLKKAVSARRQSFQRREVANPGTEAGAKRQCREAEGISRTTRRGLSERRARALQSGWLLFRPAGFPAGHRTLQESD